MGRRPIGKMAMSGAERQRRYQRKLAEGYDIGPLKAHIRELEAELARSAKQRADSAVTKPVTKHSTGSSTGDGTSRIRELEADVRLLKDELARERAQRKAAEARTSPTTDRIAELEKLLHKYSLKIDGLQGQNKRMAKAQGGMRVDEYNKILKVLHPDRKPSEAEKNEAFRLFTKSMKPFVLKDDDMTTITTTPPMPRTREDWEALKRYAKAQRSAKRAAARLFKKKT
jgi:hypothetical protein